MKGWGSLFGIVCLFSGCGSTVWVGGRYESLSASKTNRELIAITDRCGGEMLEQVWNQILNRENPEPLKYETESKDVEFDALEHVLVLRVSRGALLRIRDFGSAPEGATSLSGYSPAHFLVQLPNSLASLELPRGLPRLHFKTLQSDEFDSLGNRIQHPADWVVSARELRLWLPDDHSERVVLINSSTQKPSLLFVDTLAYARCLKDSVTR